MSTQEIKVKASVDVDVQNAQAQLASLESQSAELKKKIATATTEFNQRMSRSMSILENNLTHMMGEQIATTPYAYGKDGERQRQIRNKYINEKMTAGEVLKTAPKPLGLMEKMNMARLEKQSAKGTISSSGSSTLKTLQKRQEDSSLMSLYIGDKETKSLAKANKAYLREVQEANAQLEQLAARRKEIMKNFPSLAPQASSSYVPTSKSITSTKMERPDSVYQRRQAEIRKEQAQEMKAAREANIGKKYQIGKTTSIGTHSFKGSDGKDIAYPAVYSSALTGLKYTTSTGKQKEVTGETAVSKRILDELYKRNQTAANGESAQTIIDRIFSDLSRAIDQIDTGNVDTQTLSQLESVIRNFAGYKEGGPEFTRKSQGLRENFNKIKNSMIQWQTQMQSEAGDMQSDDSEAIEFSKWQQSQGQKYVTDKTDQQAFARKQQEYIDEFVSQYQKEAGTTGKRKHTGLTWSDVAKSIRLDPANKDIKQSVPYNVNQDGEIEGVQEENISAMLRNIMRFSVAGDVVGGNAEAQYFLGDSQKDALSVMQKLTAHLRSNPKVAWALDGKGGYGSNEQLLSLLEEMQKMYVSFLEGYNDDQMDGGIKSQIKTRLSEISQVLGNADMNGGLSKEAVDTVVKDLSPQSNRVVRSIEAKMGKATGQYPRGLVAMGGLPVQYTGGMPFMPDKENIGDNLESNFKTVEGRTELLKQFAFRAEDLKAKIAGTSDTTQQQALTTELDAVIKALNEVFNTLYSSSDPLVKNGLSASQQAGLEQIKTTGFGFANGQIKSFDQMGESDFDSANSTQLKSMIEYFQNQIKQIAPKNTGLNTVSDYKLEADALTALLMDYQQEIFTQSDMDEILSDEDTHSFSTPSVDLQDIGLEQLPWKKNANGEYQVTRQELQERVKALDAIVDSGVDPEKATEDPRYKELLSVVDGLKLKLESKLKEEEGQAIDSELQSFANKYTSASSGERGQITKQVKTQFAGNKEALAQWEQKKKAAIAEMKNKASQDASIVNGEIKEVVAQQQQSVEAVQTTTGTITPVDTPPPATPASASSSLGGAIGIESKKLGEENQQLDQHVIKMGEATQAEQAKILVSENLAKVLAGETSGIEKSNQALAQHVSTVEAASSSFDELKNKAGVLVSPDGNYVAEGYLPAYDAESHSYRNPQGQVIQSSTHVRDVLMGKFNPSFKQDMGVIQKAVASLSAGEQLTPEMVGMAGNQKTFDFMTKRAYASTEMGNVFHEVADAMAQTGAKSLGELQTKPEWAGLSKLVNQHLENLAKVGVEYTFENLENNVKAYQAAMKASGLSPTAFSETPLAFKMTEKNGQAFEFGVTPDQLFSGELGTFLMDSKTGKVGGHESFQLSMQGLAMRSVQSAYLADREGFVNGLSNKQLGLSDNASQGDVNAARQNIKNTLDVLANTDLSQLGAKIVNVKNGAVELIDNGLLTMEELFKLFQRFQKIKTGEAQPLNEEEQTAMMNRQRNTGRFYGTHDGSAPSFDGSAKQSSNSKLINSYISNYNQQMRVEERLQKANYDLNGKKGDALISQQSAVKALEQQLNLIKAQAPQLDLVNGTLNGQKLTQQEIDALLQRRSLADAQHLSNQARINAAQKQQVGFFGKLVGGLKNQMAMFIDTSLAYQAIGKIRQAITTLINTTKELDSALVDIQIATGNTRQETRALFITYSDLAKEMGRTTQNVAQASNDWLRAGYEGQEAAELTRASMMLSTLGMIEATEATTYLISTLKGWKISANEVIDVVDKLTAVDMAAAISAGDLALAMSRANNSARVAGSDMNKFIGYVTTVADVTQKSAESVGESFKTIYSRFGNVKANKYVATTADMNEADYNSDEFENLNDIETVLTKQGIRLRETAGTWRDIDTVIEEIATKWKTWDQTTKSAVATVVAGTRQRENVITLFENWDDVAKYAEIAENAYGTATSKMEAYTESVEASRQRLTVAVEQWALKLNQSDALKAFYDGLTFLVENIHTVSLTLLGIASFANFEKVATTFSSGLMNLSSKVMGLGNVFDGVKNTRGKVTWGSFSGGIEAGLNQSHLLAQQEAYGRQLDSYTKVLGQQQVQSVKLMQTELLRMDAESKKTMATILSSNMNEMEAQKLIETMSAKDRVILAETLLTQEIMATSSFTKEEARQRIEAIAASNGLELSEEELMAVTEQLIAQRRKMGATAGGAVGGNLANSAKTSAKTQLIGGAASIIGMGLGAYGGGGAVELIGEKVLGVDVGDTGKTLGTMLGGTIGAYAASSLATALPTAISSIAAGAGASALIPLIGPAIAVGTLVGGAIYSMVKKAREQEIKEAQEDFKELEQKYTEAKSLTTVAAKFDELSKGVDSFGRNVSLSEDEYQSFLDCSNQLVDAFPQLLSYTDAEGNSIAIMGSEAQTTSEYVETLIKDMQKLADQKMIVPEVMGEALKNAQKEFKDTYDKVYGHEILGFGDTVEEKAAQAQAFLSGAPITQDGYLSKSDIEGMVQLPHSNVGAYDMSLTDNLDNYFEKFANSDGKISMDDYYYYQDYITKYQALMGAEALRDNESFTLDTLRESGYSEAAIALIQEAYDGWGVQIGEWNNNIWSSLSTLSDEAFQKLYLHDSNTKDFQPEFSSNVAKDFLTQYNNLQANINNINNSMTDYALAYARTQGIFDGLSEEQSIVMKQALSGINVAKVDEEGNVVSLTQEEYQAAVLEVANGIYDLFDGDNNIVEIAVKLDEAKTTQDFEAARGELLKALIDVFGADGFSEDEKKIMIAYGFEHDGSDDFGADNFTDTKSRLQQLADALGIQKDDIPDEWKIGNMNKEDYNKIFEMAKSRIITSNTSVDKLYELLAVQNSGNNLKSALTYSAYLQAPETKSEFESEVTKYLEGINKDSEISINEISETFSLLPENVHQQIYQVAEEIKNGKNNVEDALKELSIGFDQAKVDSMINVAKIQASDQFSGIEFDGYIDSWSELKDALDQVRNSYEMLRNATKEYNAQGYLSWETTLNLLSANADYVNALKIGKNGIELKNDAEEIMIGYQISAIKTNIEAAIAEKKLSIEQLRKSIQESKSGKVTVDTTNTTVQAINERIKANNALAESIAQVINLQTMQDTGTMGTVTANAIDEVTSSITYSGDELLAMVDIWEKQAGKFDETTGEWSEGTFHRDIATLENLKGGLEDLAKNGYSAKFWESKFDAPDLDGGDVKDEFEKLKDLMGALNKEFHQMLAYADEGLRTLDGTAKKMHDTYYEVKGKLIDKAIARGEVLLGGRSLEDIYKMGDEDFDKYLGYYTELQELYVERNNLDDEEIEDKIKIAELEGANLATMKDIYAQLIGVQNTYNSGVSLLDTSYFQGKLNQIYSEKKAISDILANNEEKLTEEELLKYREDLLKLDNEESALKDEYLNKLKEQFESEQSNLDIRKDLQKDLITHADTYEELLQRQQEYNDLLKEEQDLRQSIASALNEEYLAMSAFNSGSQTSYFDSKEEALKGVEEAINTRIMNNKFATGEIVPVQALETGHAPKGLQVGTYVSTSDGRIYQVMGVGETAFGSIEEGYNLGYSYNQASGYWSQETDFIANGTPLKDSDYISLIQDQQSNFVDQRNLDDERIQHEINLLKGQKADLNAITAQYKQLIETADTEEEYYEYYQQYLDAFIEEFDDKISDIQRQIDNLEKARPQEWKSTVDKSGKVVESATSKIKDYYSKMDQYYKNQKSAAEEALKYSAELTEEEIEHLVDQANDAIKSIHENAIAQAEDLKAYQESVYSALTNEVQRYIDDLEKQKENVEKTYDKELEKLQDKEDAIARTNKLIELQNNLLNAQKEKERVYREGIGWTYESNREKVKTAEDELNGFYRQDNIDDLNNAKDAELQNLNDRIMNWEDYLAMLNEKYNEYALLEEKRLLKELLNVETDAEIKAAIVADMTKFTTELSLNYDTFIANQSAFYLSYNSTFSSFLTEYSNNLATLAELKSKELSLLSVSNYSSMNLSGSFGGSNSGGYYTGSDADLMNKHGIVAGWSWTNTDYQDDWIQGEGYEHGSIYKNSDGTYTVYDGKQNYMGTINSDGSITSNAGDLGENYLNNANKFIQINDSNYGSNKTSGGGSGSKNNSWSGMVDSAKQNASSGGISGLTPSTSNNSNKTTTSNSGNSTKAVDDAVVNAVIRGNYGNGAARKEALTAAGYDASAVQKAVNERLKGHADGILSGPVTYTGLTMLHGTSSEPEYVLNNDQAYNLLRYMATKKMPEFEVAGSNSSGVQYIVEGDIVLEGVDNPQEFWGEVTKAMGNRWNVTKNR